MKTTWKTTYCKLGQGKLCCIHLVTDGTEYRCNKLIAQPDTFVSLPGATGNYCTGIRDLAKIETSFAISVGNYERLGLSFAKKLPFWRRGLNSILSLFKKYQ